MLSAVVFLILGGLLARPIKNRRLKIYVLTLPVLATFLVGCSRIYLGVHWRPPMSWPAGGRVLPERYYVGQGRSCSRGVAVWKRISRSSQKEQVEITLSIDR